MKRNYIRPQMEITELDDRNIVCASVKMQIEAIVTQPTTGETPILPANVIETPSN